MSEKVYIVSACRTAIGNFGGALASTNPVALGSVCAKAALERAGVSGAIDEVIVGNVLGAGHGMNISRQIAMEVGLAESVPTFTVNKVCGSGLKALCLGALQIQSRRADCVLAGGVESMSQAPYVSLSNRFGARMGAAELKDLMISDGLTDAMLGCHMGVTAENIAKEFNIRREDQDRFAYESQRKARAAIEAGYFKDEIVPVPLFKKGEVIGEFSVDEYPRETSVEKLSNLRPAFDKAGTVTAGNASGINDGAAFLVLANEKWVHSHDVSPLAEMTDWASAGVDPKIMGTGPIAAVNKLQEQSGLKLSELDLIESNEAFAAQAIAVDRQLGWDTAKVNVGGGAIALGHPIGASGARIVVTLLYHMKRLAVESGLSTLCVGGGQGIAASFKRVV